MNIKDNIFLAESVAHMRGFEEEILPVVDFSREALEIFKTMDLSAHPPNPNDDGNPCICSNCETKEKIKKLLYENL